MGPTLWLNELILQQQALASHMGANSHCSFSSSYATPCIRSGKAVQNGPNPHDLAPTCQTQRGSSILALNGLGYGICGSLGNEATDGRFSLFLSLSKSVLSINIHKSSKNICELYHSSQTNCQTNKRYSA